MKELREKIAEIILKYGLSIHQSYRGKGDEIDSYVCINEIFSLPEMKELIEDAQRGLNLYVKIMPFLEQLEEWEVEENKIIFCEVSGCPTAVVTKTGTIRRPLRVEDIDLGKWFYAISVIASYIGNEVMGTLMVKDINPKFIENIFTTPSGGKIVREK